MESSQLEMALLVCVTVGNFGFKFVHFIFFDVCFVMKCERGDLNVLDETSSNF